MNHLKGGCLAFVAALALVFAVSFSVNASSLTPLQLDTIQPWQTPSVAGTFKINIVFVGYEPGDIDLPHFQAGLPQTYKPIVRYPGFYGIHVPLGFNSTYVYNVQFADAAFESDFFSFLAQSGSPDGLTSLQEDYNDQLHNTLDVTGPVLYIDAPSTEKWLMQQGQARLGIGDNYTVFLVNWYSQPDFQFHVYTKTDDPDPDTGYNFGLLRDSRKMIAWGGTHGRTWFYDLSAGPESWTDNWNVDDGDVDGDGSADYRMPPVWEYGNLAGYRPFDDLSGDLAKVVRYVAIDELFTTAPLYDPLASQPLSAVGKKVLSLTLFQGEPGVDGRKYINTGITKAALANLQPYEKWVVKQTTRQYSGGPKKSARITLGLSSAKGCWLKYGDPFAQLFCFFDGHRKQYLRAVGPGDSVGGVYAFNAENSTGLLGYADDNWVNGVPTFVFQWDNALYRSLGYGMTTTTIHEFGHHIGMSHPHDGYDSDSGMDFDASGAFYFAWSGDESHTTMQYIALVTGFGTFDRDNMNRFIFERVLTRSSDIAQAVLAANQSAEVRGALQSADAKLTEARARYDRMDYAGAADLAMQSYRLMQTAAGAANVALAMPDYGPAAHPAERYVDYLRKSAE